jgi:hypothetical protein
MAISFNSCRSLGAGNEKSLLLYLITASLCMHGLRTYGAGFMCACMHGHDLLSSWGFHSSSMMFKYGTFKNKNDVHICISVSFIFG